MVILMVTYLLMTAEEIDTLIDYLIKYQGNFSDPFLTAVIDKEDNMRIRLNDSNDLHKYAPQLNLVLNEYAVRKETEDVFEENG